jgi:cytochrome c oxidase subunit 2
LLGFVGSSVPVKNMPVNPTFTPVSPQALSVNHLFIWILIMSAFIFMVVTGLSLYAIVKFRQRPGDGEPEQNYGSVTREILWTAGPLLLLAGTFVFTVRVMQTAVPAEGAEKSRQPDLTIVGHQWWWEVSYPQYGVTTANEIHIPAGKKLFAQIKSADVIHDFWAPELGPKIDAVPGHPNYLWVQADTPGYYEGTCAEFCGAEHAWMRIQVYAHPEEEFQAWIKDQSAYPPPPSTKQEALGLQLYGEKLCDDCHSAAADIGPDLTHLGSRKTLGTGILRNTPENLAKWLTDPQAVKPGIHMPDMHLSKSEVQALTVFLESLK